MTAVLRTSQNRSNLRPEPVRVETSRIDQRAIRFHAYRLGPRGAQRRPSNRDKPSVLLTS